MLAGLCYQHNNVSAFKSLINSHNIKMEDVLMSKNFIDWAPHLSDFYDSIPGNLLSELDLSKMEKVTLIDIYPCYPLYMATARKDVKLFEILLKKTNANIIFLKNDKSIYDKAKKIVTLLLNDAVVKNNKLLVNTYVECGAKISWLKDPQLQSMAEELIDSQKKNRPY